MDKYRVVAKPMVKAGNTILFWFDEWEIGNARTPLRARFARFFSFAINDMVSVLDMWQSHDRAAQCHLPLSSREYDEFTTISSCLDGVELSSTENDEWKCQWKDGAYVSAKYYALVHEPIVSCPVYQWIWRSKCIMRIKIFSWLLISDRLNTRDLLRNRNWRVTEDNHCELWPGRHYEDM
jgi:hypothetical protein